MASAALTAARSWALQAMSRTDTSLPHYEGALDAATTQQQIADARIDLGMLEGARAAIRRASFKLGEMD